MLNPPDLSGFDLDNLSTGLLLLTQRQHRCLRQANHLTDAEGHPGIASEIDNLDRDAASAAEAHRLVCLLRRVRSDEGYAPPRDPIDHLRAIPTPAPPRPGIFVRTMALLGRGHPTPSPIAKRDVA